MRGAHLHTERVHKTGKVLRVRPTGGHDTGAIRVAGGTGKGAHVAERVAADDAGRGRSVRAVHVPDVPGHAAQVRPADRTVHQDTTRATVEIAPGRRRQAPVQKGPDRVPEAQDIRVRPIRAAGPQRRAKAVGIPGSNARAQQRHLLLRRRVQLDVMKYTYCVSK